MTEQEAIELLDKMKEPYEEKDNEALNMAIIALKKQSNNNWIPCKEKMPEDCEEYKGKDVINVLVTTDSGRVTKVQRIHDKYNEQDYWYWGRIYGKMKAWMSLPKAYKEKC